MKMRYLNRKLTPWEKQEAEELDRITKDSEELIDFGWFMYDSDEEDGLNDGFVVLDSKKPVSGKPDARNHIWKAFRLYRKSEVE
jgi:hypothetical protein